MYNVDWNTVVEREIPHVLRKPRLTTWLLALVSPVAVLSSSFSFFRQRLERELTITGQTRVLRYWLNRLFDPDLKRITVVDLSPSEFVYAYREDENRPLYLPQFLSGSSADFTVFVPSSLSGLDENIRAFLDKYKLVTMRYRINYFLSPDDVQ